MPPKKKSKQDKKFNREKRLYKNQNRQQDRPESEDDEPPPPTTAPALALERARRQGGFASFFYKVNLYRVIHQLNQRFQGNGNAPRNRIRRRNSMPLSDILCQGILLGALLTLFCAFVYNLYLCMFSQTCDVPFLTGFDSIQRFFDPEVE